MTTVEELQAIRKKYLDDNVVYWALTLAISAKLYGPLNGLEEDVRRLLRAIESDRASKPVNNTDRAHLALVNSGLPSRHLSDSRAILGCTDNGLPDVRSPQSIQSGNRMTSKPVTDYRADLITFKLMESTQYDGMLEIEAYDENGREYYLCTTPCGRICLRESNNPETVQNARKFVKCPACGKITDPDNPCIG